MLIRFTVENFLSFNKRCDFNTIASPEERHPHHVIKEDNNESVGLLRTSIIYGANASGKSNLIKSMFFAQQTILGRENILYKKFKLDENCENKPSRFEYEFKIGDRQYAYGFSLDKSKNESKIHGEWLFEIGLTLEKPIFEREYNTIKFNFESSLLLRLNDEERKQLEDESKNASSQILFLTYCKNNNIKYFESILYWFQETLKIIFPHTKGITLTLTVQQYPELVDEFLEAFGLGIQKIELNESQFNNSEEIPDSIRDRAADRYYFRDLEDNIICLTDSDITIKKMKDSDRVIVSTLNTVHDRHDNITFEIPEESEGTQRIIDFIPMLISLTLGDVVFIVDEIGRSLHSLLLENIFDIFLNFNQESENPVYPRSQLIATTHDTHLLVSQTSEYSFLDSERLFRNDEIWFVEKDKTEQSIMYSLANTNVDDLDLAKGYFNGRFGALNFVRKETLKKIVQQHNQSQQKGEENV
ncbi:MAG: ATP-binding protein [Cyanobacteria bacterium SBLK]|nr:ATP-binding protein [Cyanobacteria bacterium SBLK]